MTSAARPEVIDEELYKAQRCLRSADLLATQDLYDDALGRLYFAAFHWVRAMLASEDLEAKSHKGVHSLFNLHFIKIARIEPHFQDVFSRLETWRNKGDYELGFVAGAELFEEERAATETLNRSAHAYRVRAGFSS